MLDDMLKEAKKKKLRILRGTDKKLDIVWVPFDIPQIDNMMGGGLPLGRMVLIVGNFGVGKTFFTQMCIANFQKLGRTAAYVDTERRYDPTWFKNSGINTEELSVAQPDSGEDALDICAFLIEQRVDLVVLDSIAALVPTAELEGTMEDNTIASQARLLNKGLRKTTKLNIASDDLTYQGTSFVAINQLRSGIGPFTTYALPGGKGQQYFASSLIRINRGSYIEEGKKRIGFNLKMFSEKNNLAPSLRECSIPFLFSGNIDTVGGLIELAIDMKVIKQAGPYYTLPGVEDDKKIMGRVALAAKLKEDSRLFNILKEAVYASDNEVS